MPYQIFPGEFGLYYTSQLHVGSRPDGDSMWFKPIDGSILEMLGERSVNYNKGGFTQLRFEGIDALELHYKGANHQKLPECVDARDRLLEIVGFTSVTYAPSSTADVNTSVRDAIPIVIPGYILSRGADIYGRPVAFVFTGIAPEPETEEGVWLTPELMSQSLNARLIADGQAYPSFYTGLPYDLRDQLRTLMQQAQNDHKGLWVVDSSKTGIQVNNTNNLKQFAIWPKLYRRIFDFFEDGNTNIADFEDWIRDGEHDRDDEVWIISRGELGNLHDVFEVTTGTLRLVVDPDNMVIVPR